MSARAFDGYEIVSDERIGDGGFLRIRRVRLCVRRSDGTLSKEGLYDFIERPMGADAVVLLLWHRAADGVRVLLRHAPRVPLYFRDPAVGAEHAEVVAGIIEAGEDGWAAIQARAAAEAHEEAGLTIAPSAVERLGPAAFPTAGMFSELFYFAAAEVADPASAVRPPTDGSPFEEGARLEWVALDEALRRCDEGAIRDLKTELA
ncbi:MAG TPA: NUDIX hydrolase, partial [Polyangia bacterium]